MHPEKGIPSVMGVEQCPPPRAHRPSHTESDKSHMSHSSATLNPQTSCPPPCDETPRRTTVGSRLERACLNLPPAFFSLNMGTGITSILLHNLPYGAEWLRRLGTVIFVLNIALFVLISVGTIVRYIRWKGVFTAVNNHCVAGMFWGCLPMGFATIVVSISCLE